MVKLGAAAAGALAAGALALAAGCGGGSGARCGNGVVEMGEQCDDGMITPTCSVNCARVTTDLRLRWTLIAAEFPDFNESCPGVGAETAEFTFHGPGGATRVETAPCNFSETQLLDWANGDWVVTGRLLDDQGVQITNDLAMASFTIAGVDTTATIDFPFADFSQSFTGTYYFRTKWGGATTCGGALPPVVTHRLLLSRAGSPLVGMTDAGDAIDGTGTGQCRNFSGGSTQSILALPWGPADFTITGYDVTGTAQFEETFPTFIGAGIQNPEYEHDVNSLTPDAGVPDASPPDATPDAGIPDAVASDAM
jgi:hypothetical protein